MKKTNDIRDGKIVKRLPTEEKPNDYPFLKAEDEKTYRKENEEYEALKEKSGIAQPKPEKKKPIRLIPARKLNAPIFFFGALAVILIVILVFLILEMKTPKWDAEMLLATPRPTVPGQPADPDNPGKEPGETLGEYVDVSDGVISLKQDYTLSESVCAFATVREDEKTVAFDGAFQFDLAGNTFDLGGYTLVAPAGTVFADGVITGGRIFLAGGEGQILFFNCLTDETVTVDGEAGEIFLDDAAFSGDVRLTAESMTVSGGCFFENGAVLIADYLSVEGGEILLTDGSQVGELSVSDASVFTEGSVSLGSVTLDDGAELSLAGGFARRVTVFGSSALTLSERATLQTLTVYSDGVSVRVGDDAMILCFAVSEEVEIPLTAGITPVSLSSDRMAYLEERASDPLWDDLSSVRDLTLRETVDLLGSLVGSENTADRLLEVAEGIATWENPVKDGALAAYFDALAAFVRQNADAFAEALRENYDVGFDEFLSSLGAPDSLLLPAFFNRYGTTVIFARFYARDVADLITQYGEPVKQILSILFDLDNIESAVLAFLRFGSLFEPDAGWLVRESTEDGTLYRIHPDRLSEALSLHNDDTVADFLASLLGLPGFGNADGRRLIYETVKKLPNVKAMLVGMTVTGLVLMFGATDPDTAALLQDRIYGAIDRILSEQLGREVSFREIASAKETRGKTIYEILSDGDKEREAELKAAWEEKVDSLADLAETPLADFTVGNMPILPLIESVLDRMGGIESVNILVKDDTILRIGVTVGGRDLSVPYRPETFPEFSESIFGAVGKRLSDLIKI